MLALLTGSTPLAGAFALAGISAMPLCAARLQDAVDLDSVRDDLARVVTRSLEPAHLPVWVSSRY